MKNLIITVIIHLLARAHHGSEPSPTPESPTSTLRIIITKMPFPSLLPLSRRRPPMPPPLEVPRHPFSLLTIGSNGADSLSSLLLLLSLLSITVIVIVTVKSNRIQPQERARSLLLLRRRSSAICWTTSMNPGRSSTQPVIPQILSPNFFLYFPFFLNFLTY